MAATWPRYLFFLYLLNQCTNLLQNFTKFMQFLSVMHRTVTKHIFTKNKMAATWPRYLFFRYLLNQWTNLLQNFTKFMQFLSSMHRTVTKHIYSKTRWRRLDLDTCFFYISWTNGPICSKISPNLCNFFLLCIKLLQNTFHQNKMAATWPRYLFFRYLLNPLINLPQIFTKFYRIILF